MATLFLRTSGVHYRQVYCIVTPTWWCNISINWKKIWQKSGADNNYRQNFKKVSATF